MTMNVKANALNAAFLLSIAATSYFVTNGLPADAEPDAYQEPPFSLDSVESQAWLRAAPPPSSSPYDGVGNPTVVVTHTSNHGGLHRALHSAEVWSEEPGGLDACNEAWLRFDAFYVATPTGGATADDGNVTYVSDTYGSPMQYGPGGDQCSARFSVGKTWHWRVCIEFDGSLDEPQPTWEGTVFDDWDRCIEGTSAPSSTPDPLGSVHAVLPGH